MTMPYTVPGLDEDAARKITTALQDRLVATLDLQLTLKHVHWNVVGPSFIGVHEMLDDAVDSVREVSDELAERIAALGGEPVGTPGFVTKHRSWDDYSIGRATTQQHLAALDLVYNGVIADYREAIGTVGDIDPVTEDMLISHVQGLEKFQWFLRAHLADAAGHLQHEGEQTEEGAAGAAG